MSESLDLLAVQDSSLTQALLISVNVRNTATLLGSTGWRRNGGRSLDQTQQMTEPNPRCEPLRTDFVDDSCQYFGRNENKEKSDRDRKDNDLQRL